MDRTASPFPLLRALAWSAGWVVVGLCFVLPWALVGYGAYRLFLRLRGRPATTA